MKEYCSNLIHSIKNYKILIALFYSVLLIGLAILFLPIRFEENDDVVMLLLASGNYTGHFESNLIFINPIYGSFVSMLYSYFKDIEWYTVLFVFFHFISFTIVIHKLISLHLNRIIVFSFVAFLSVIVLSFLMYLQFTTVAIMIALAGIILFQKSNRNNIIFAFLFILIASLIRSEVTLLLVLFFSLYHVYTYFILKNYRKLVLFAFLLFIPVFSIIVRDKLVSKEWVEATKYNRLRAEVTDNLNADFNSSIYEGVCSEQDYALLKKFFPHPDVINMNVLKGLSMNIKKKKTQASSFNNIKNQLKLYQRDFLLLFIIVFLILLFMKSSKTTVSIILYSVFLLSFLAYISIDGLLKNRIFLGFVLTSIILLLFTIEKKNRFTLFQSYALSCGMLLLSFYYIRRLTEKVEETNAKRGVNLNEQISLVNHFFNANPHQNLTPYGDDLKLQYLNPFEISKITKKWNLYYLGWMTKNPHNSKYERSMQKSIHIFFNNFSYTNSERDFKDSDEFMKFNHQGTLNSTSYKIVSFDHEIDIIK